jgi:glycosyltransferase involved in cell wall biosynthesis
MHMNDLAVIILTWNEEMHIARAIASVSTVASQIFVVDSFSTDRTIAIAESLGAKVCQRAFDSQARQFQWALDNLPITASWVMRLDADEVLDDDLVSEIKTKLPILDPAVTGINLRRKQIFMGRWIRHGGRYPLVMLRIWRRGAASIEDRWMDEHVILLHGRSVTLDGGFADHNLKDLTHFIDKHNKYATREAIEVLNQKYGLFERQPGIDVGSTWGQAGIKRRIKLRIYNKVPFQISSLLYFLYRYFLRLGFLDGKEGLIYHVLQGFWYRLLVGAKVLELERAIARSATREHALRELSRLTGLRLRADGTKTTQSPAQTNGA